MKKPGRFLWPCIGLIAAGLLISTPPGQAAGRDHYQKDYTFWKDWFTYNIPVWKQILGPWKGKPALRYLEVGVFEGRSLFWMLENILTAPDARATAVDLFPEAVRERFEANLTLSGFRNKVDILEGDSAEVLRNLPDANYDLIYIDASHRAADTLTDAVLCWPLLKTGGLLLFDDYLLEPDLPAELTPRLAVDSFISGWRHEIEIVHTGYQVILRKRENPCDPPAHCSPFGDYYFSWTTRMLYRLDNRQPVSLSTPETAALEAFLKSPEFGHVQPLEDAPAARNPVLAGLLKRLNLNPSDLTRPPK